MCIFYIIWYIGLSNADFKLYYKINLYEIVIYLNLYIGYLVNKCRNLNEYSNKKNQKKKMVKEKYLFKEEDKNEKC